MLHRFFRVELFDIVGPYTIDVRFDDKKSVLIDFEPVLHGELFGPLRDTTLFDRVIIDREVGTLVWPNGADFDPATLHDWETQGPLLKEAVAKWELVTA